MEEAILDFGIIMVIYKKTLKTLITLIKLIKQYIVIPLVA
jgi:hypothetical protein